MQGGTLCKLHKNAIVRFFGGDSLLGYAADRPTCLLASFLQWGHAFSGMDICRLAPHKKRTVVIITNSFLYCNSAITCIFIETADGD